MKLKIPFSFLALCVTFGSANAYANSCDATGASLNAAKNAFARQCSGETRRDCDPLSNGRWRCANFTIGSNAGTSTRAVPAPSRASNPAPPPVVTQTAPETCEATAGSLRAARRAFSSECSGFTRQDCDPIAGGWVCASFSIGDAPSSVVSTPEPRENTNRTNANNRNTGDDNTSRNTNNNRNGNDSDLDGIPNNRDLCRNTPQSETANRRGCGQASQASFSERNGLVVVEMESTNYGDGWEFKTGQGSLGRGFLEWDGGDNFNRQGVGTITVPVVITNAGTYQFSWRSIVNRGNSSTESNDSWVRIDADNFFARKLRGGSNQSRVGNILCPREQLRSNACRGGRPEGSSGDGYFKAYRTGSPVRDWRWVTGTSDRDRHEIFATFNAPGTYNVRISGRSDGHAIDRFVLHLVDSRSGANTISNNDAIESSNPESARQ